jgi:hypothetical protein
VFKRKKKEIRRKKDIERILNLSKVVKGNISENESSFQSDEEIVKNQQKQKNYVN